MKVQTKGHISTTISEEGSKNHWKQFINKLLLGNSHNLEDLSEHKRALLTSQLSVFSIVCSLFYVSFDLYHGSNSSILLYSLLFLFSITALQLNRWHKFESSKILYLIGVNLVLFVSSEIKNPGNGVFLFFLVSILAAFALLGFEGKAKSILLTLFSVSLFLISFHYDFDFIPHTELPESAMRVNFIINFMVSAGVTVIIIIFLVDLNTKSKNILKATSEELLKNQRRFQLAVEGSSAGIWDWDLTSNKIYMSPALKNLLGNIEIPKISSDVFQRIIHPEDLDFVNKALSDHLEHGIPFSIECRFFVQGGDYIWVHDTGQAEWDANGNPVRMVGSVVNINERKVGENLIVEKNKQLKKTNEELDKFVYSTSHDLRAPLSSFLGLINIAEIAQDQEELQTCLRLMRSRVNTLHGFIDDIVDYSRNSRLGVNVEPVNLHEMTDDIIGNLEYSHKRGSIRVIEEFPLNFVLDSDKVRLRVILNNIITNAIKYHNINQKDPFIRIRATKDDFCVRIDITDNGSGIDEQYINKIFNMFYRAAENSEGSGLGLYIAQEMTQKLLGDLKVDSTLGESTTFSLTLPKSIKFVVGKLDQFVMA